MFENVHPFSLSLSFPLNTGPGWKMTNFTFDFHANLTWYSDSTLKVMSNSCLAFIQAIKIRWVIEFQRFKCVLSSQISRQLCEVYITELAAICVQFISHKGLVINSLREGPEDKVLGRDTFCLQIVGSWLKFKAFCWVTTLFLKTLKCPPAPHSC